MTVAFTVVGEAVPQGSKKLVRGNRLIDVKPAELRAWRDRIAWRATAARSLDLYDTPVVVRLVFAIERNGAHRRDIWCGVTPDVDKLSRAVLDGLCDGGLLRNDSRVALLIAAKRYVATGQPPGVYVEVSALGDEIPPEAVA